jgi:hypothetical protein
MNAASINIASNFIMVCESTLKRYAAASTELEKRAALDTDTVQGLHWAIDFVQSIGRDVMTEAELKHAVRLTKFRGQRRPEFRG